MAKAKEPAASRSSGTDKCPHCHGALSVKGKFCHLCGRLLGESSDGHGVSAWAVEDLFDIARTLSSTLDLDVLLKKIGQVAERLTEAEASSLLLLDDDRKNLFFKTATGSKSQILRRCLVPVGQGLAGWVAQHWKPLVVNDVSQDSRFTKTTDNATGFVTRSVLAVPVLLGGELIGVCEAINKKSPGGFTAADQDLLQNLANFAAVPIINARLADTQKNFFTNMIEILTAAIESRDPRYLGHPSRVAETACAIGRKLGVDGQAYRDLYYGALLHDIGMIALNHQTLLDQATVLGRERSAERLHPVLGTELIKGVKLLRGVVPVVRHHHELWDGTGHPDRLAGEQIPLSARIICLVEYLEEIRISGVVEPELTRMQIQMAKNGAGHKFDPKVVEAYLSLTAVEV